MSRSGRITVSIVEDQADVRDQIMAYLEDAPGVKCLGSYASAEEAFQNVPKLVPDVLLIDINLGGTSGIECTRKLKL